MTRLVDLLSVLLLLAALGAFASGLSMLSERRDLFALYWFGVGLASLRASTQLLRPKAGSR
ncbi:MAG: hypothetical protein QM756_22060 [Polyangiaceae bacterium]